MLGFIMGPVIVVGGATACIQVARGVVRGVGKLVEGEPGHALAEVAGGLVAPVFALIHQTKQLGLDVCKVAGVLSDDGQSVVRFDRAA